MDDKSCRWKNFSWKSLITSIIDNLWIFFLYATLNWQTKTLKLFDASAARFSLNWILEVFQDCFILFSYWVDFYSFFIHLLFSEIIYLPIHKYSIITKNQIWKKTFASLSNLWIFCLHSLHFKIERLKNLKL